MKKTLRNLALASLLAFAGTAMATEVTFDFTSEANLGNYVADLPDWSTDGSNFKIDLTSMDYEGVNVSFEKLTSTANPSRFYKTSGGKIDFRFYQNNDMTISVPKGMKIDELLFRTEAASNTNINKLAVKDSKFGAFDNSTSKSMKWVAPEGIELNSIVLDASGVVRADFLTVTYSEVTGETEEEPLYPAVMYAHVTGEKGWDLTKGYKMDKSEEWFYTATDVYIYPNGGDYGYMTFSAANGTNAGDWDTINVRRYGPMEDGTEVEEPVCTDVERGETAWKVVPGVYTIVFDLSEYAITIEKTAELPEPEVPETYPTLYVMGAGDGLGWDFPGKTFDAVDGQYVLDIKNLTKFKVSTVKATAWDGDGQFNSGALGFTTQLGDAVATAAGQTVNLVAWGEDLEMPWTGDYVITISGDLKTMNVKTTTPKPTNGPAIYIRGGMNGWGSPAAWQLTCESWDGNSGVYTFTGTIPAGQEFKIADANWGTANYTFNNTNLTPELNKVYNLTYNGNNSKLATEFTGTLTLNITNYTGHVATAVFSDGTGGEIKYAENYYLIGTINGGAWNPKNVAQMAGNGEGVYTIEGVTLSENGGSTGFAITGFDGTSEDWNAVNAERYGPAVKDTKAVIGENKVDGMGDCSWTIDPGTYNMVFDIKAKTLTISGTVKEPDLTPETLYLIGHVNDNDMVPNVGLAPTSAEEFVFTYDNVVVRDVNEGYGYITFLTELGKNENDWTSSTRLGAIEEDAEVEATTEGYTVDADWTNYSWKVPAGKYNIVADYNEFQVIFTLIDEEFAFADFSAEAGISELDNTGMDFYIEVTVHNLPAGEKVEVYYKQAEESDEAYKLATPVDELETMQVASVTTTAHKFTISDLNKKDKVVVNYYAKVGEQTSDVMTYEVPVTTGVEGIVVDGAEDAIYFNLQGVRVANPVNGAIYIRVQGTEATKVVK